ncbi:OmpA family protein [Fulvimarina sp. MAC8]|uniref:OmpA family protein n=1 Tax=Fulvimarina sp. MAC8 TaxID=3162874 RepID=UPI0032EFE9F7
MIKKIATVLCLSVALAGCTTDPYTGEMKISNTLGGAGLGTGLGAAGGYLVARATGSDEATAAAIGAGLGGLAGAGIGAYMDNQEAQLRQQLQGTGVSVTRVGDRIILNMPSNVTFPTDQSQILPAFYSTLDSVAIVLQKFDETIVNVYGHTDSQGSDGYNLTLSQQRASSVSQFLASRGVNPNRLNTQGYGESQPIADNSTEAGRARNRRVEVQISPLSTR